ncbi:hypothetical protein HDV05_007836 [Chytridiales sp. JEL 0842]|nr:hypothetical protein HDV05_007836 [Chytridiales sp. JEL 0842]
MSGLTKKIGQLKQRVGGAQKTDTSDAFKQLQHQTDTLQTSTTQLQTSLTKYLSDVGIPKDPLLGKIATSKKNSMEAWAESMQTLGRELLVSDAESEYGKCLVRCGEAHEEVGSLQNEFAGVVQAGFGGELGRVLSDFKEYTRLKTKMENRRLDFDAKLNRIQKSKKENTVLEEETRVAQVKYEETMEALTEKMRQVTVVNEEDQLAALVGMVHAEVEHYRKVLDVLERLKDEFSGVKLPERKPLSPLTRTDSTTVGKKMFGAFTGGSSSKTNTPSLGMSRSNSQSANLGHSRSASQTGNGFGAGGGSLMSRSGSMQNGLSAGGGGWKAKEKEEKQSLKFLKQVRVLYDFDAEGPGELTIRKGDVVNVTNEIDEGWWEGELERDASEFGMFPANYTE